MGNIGIASPTTMDHVPFGLGPDSIETKEYKMMELVKKLIATWEQPTSDDKSHFQLYMKLVRGIVETDNQEFKQQIAAYKLLLRQENNDDVFTIIFLLRRSADQPSFYEALNSWENLAFTTQEKIFKYLHTTYAHIASGSRAENQELANLLIAHKSDTKNILANLPSPFSKITDTLNETEIDNYFYVLRLILVNTVAVRTLLEIAEIM